MPPGPPGWGPPGPPGPRKPNNGNAAVIIIIAVVVVVLGGGALLWWGFDVGASGGRPAAVAPTLPDMPTPPTYSPPALPSTTPFSPPDDTYSPPEDTYSPPAEHWGAIAVAHDGSVGKSWDYSSESAAEKRALRECPRTGCKVLVSFVNSCGAVAFNPHTNRYWGGRGSTKSAAERDAISNAGGGHWITWVCTTR
jgi:hypothetical protein